MREVAPFVTGFGVCTSYKNYLMLKGAGYDYVEESVGRLLSPNLPSVKVSGLFSQIKETGIEIYACNSFLPRSLKSVGEQANHETVLKYADIVFQRSKQLGVKGIVFGSSGSRRMPEGFSREKAEVQFVELLKKMAPLAQSYGVEIWLEPLNRKEDNFINTQVQGAAIIEKVGHPSLGMVCDLFHVARNGETPESFRETTRYVRHCHIAEKAKRTAPGMEKFDFKPYFSALKKGGYRGRMSMECGWENMQKQAVDVRKYVQAQIDAV